MKGGLLLVTLLDGAPTQSHTDFSLAHYDELMLYLIPNTAEAIIKEEQDTNTMVMMQKRGTLPFIDLTFEGVQSYCVHQLQEALYTFMMKHENNPYILETCVAFLDSVKDELSPQHKNAYYILMDMTYMYGPFAYALSQFLPVLKYS